MSDSEEELEEEQVAEEPCLACMGKHRAHTCGERRQIYERTSGLAEQRQRTPSKRPPSPDPASPGSSTGKKKPTAREESRQRSSTDEEEVRQRPQAALKAAVTVPAPAAAAAGGAGARRRGARVVRVEGQGRIGHIGTVTKTDPQRGMRVQLVTTDVAAAHWLPPTGQGAIWDWLTDGVRLVVSYLEDESDPGSLTDYEGLIVNYDLERLMLHVAFNNGGGDGEWVSLVEDEWHWCGRRNSRRAILGARNSFAILSARNSDGRTHTTAAGSTAGGRRTPRSSKRRSGRRSTCSRSSGCCASSTRCTRRRGARAPPSSSGSSRPGSSSRKRRRSGRNRRTGQPSSSNGSGQPARPRPAGDLTSAAGAAADAAARRAGDGQEQAADALDKLNSRARRSRWRCASQRSDGCGSTRRAARAARHANAAKTAAAPLAKLFDCNHATLHADACATLVNLTLFLCARSAVLKTNAVETAAKALMGTQAQQSAALALLQNLSLARRPRARHLLGLSPAAPRDHPPVAAAVDAAPRVSHRRALGFRRREFGSATAHVWRSIWPFASSQSKPGDTDCQKRALGILLNMSYAELASRRD